MQRRLAIRGTAVLAGTLLLALAGGCGKPSGGTAGAHDTHRAAAGSGSDVQADRTIRIQCDDRMQFSVTEIKADAGEVLEIELVNTGSMPKVSMGHNWVLLDQGRDADTYINAAAVAAAREYLPERYADWVLAATRLIGPRESASVVFTVPSRPGRYVFVCTFPGHYQVGMKGVLIVER
jgi:azurin